MGSGGGTILVLGDERFLAREAIAGLLGDEDRFDVNRYRGDQVEVARILDEVRTLSLFGKPKAVVVTEAAPLLEGDSLTAIAAYAEKPAGTALLVLQSHRLDGRLKAAKALKAAANVIDCKPVPDNQVPGWIGQRGREAYGLSMDAATARSLRARVGEDLGLLDAALTRLRDQIAPRTRLELDDVETSTEEHRSPILFEAANALEAGDLEASLKALSSGFADGIRIRRDLVTDGRAIAPILLGNLHGAYRKLLRYHMLGGDAKRIGLSPQAAYHFEQRARRHRLDRLVARHGLFEQADLALKRTEDEPRRVLEHLLMGLLAD